MSDMPRIGFEWGTWFVGVQFSVVGCLIHIGPFFVWPWLR